MSKTPLHGHLAPAKATDSSGLQKWEEVLEMFNDLIDCLRNERELLVSVAKIEVMKEGLSQVKDVLTDSSIGHTQVRHQESLVQKKLTKTLSHSSQCLFTLLLYYLYGHVRDIEVDVRCGVYRCGSENDFCLCMGRIVTFDEEDMVWSGVRQLDGALGLFKFVWGTAGMKGALQLQGHIWCVGAEATVVTYIEETHFLYTVFMFKQRLSYTVSSNLRGYLCDSLISEEFIKAGVVVRTSKNWRSFCSNYDELNPVSCRSS